MTTRRSLVGQIRKPGSKPQNVDLVLKERPVRTNAELKAGIKWVDGRYPEGHVLRYGTNTTPGTTDTQAAWANAIKAANGGTGEVVAPGGEYNLDSDLTLLSNVRIRSLGGKIKFSGTGKVLVKGTAAGNTSDLSADADRGDKTVTVVDGTQFTAGDTVEILSSPNEADNSTKLQFAELNEIASISTNTLTLKYPLAHPYTTGHTTEPKVTVIDSLKENVEFENVEFSGGNFEHAYVKGLRLKGCKLSGGTAFGSGGTTWGCSRDVEIDLSTEDDAGAATGTTSLVYLYNIADFTAKVRTYGGNQDGIRIWGCADGDLFPSVIEAANRGIWAYECDNVVFHHPVIKGSQSSTANIEVLLLDYCRDCTIRDPFIDEPNKKGGSAGPNMLEFRQVCQNCGVLGGTINVHGDLPVAVKSENINTRVEGVNFNVYATGTVQLIDFQCTTAPTESTSLLVHRNRVTNLSGGTLGVNLVRSSSGSSITGTFDLISVKHNIVDRGTASFVLINGDGTGDAISMIVVEGNEEINGSGTNGAMAQILNIPVDKVYIANNRMETPGSRRIIVSSATEVYLNNNDVDGYTITNHTKLVTDWLSTESRNAEAPNAANWLPGNIINFTDSGDASGNGLYMLMQDGTTWVKLGPEA